MPDRSLTTGTGDPFRVRLAGLLREPFFHFLALGVLIFLVQGFLGGEPERYRITVEAVEVRRLATGYEWQFGRPPSPAELRHLIDRHIEEEILYREGLAMGLDQGDEIVRRRVVQKLQFLQEDLTIVPEPSEETLRSFYEQHVTRYNNPARVTLQHLYFSPDVGGVAHARSRATEMLTTLNESDFEPPLDRGDLFPGQGHYTSIDATGLSRVFGDSQLSRAVFTLPPRKWHGPLQSGYGWHVVYIDHAEPPGRLPFAEVHTQVHADYVDERHQELNAATLAQITQKYVVIREDVDE